MSKKKKNIMDEILERMIGGVQRNVIRFDKNGKQIASETDK